MNGNGNGNGRSSQHPSVRQYSRLALADTGRSLSPSLAGGGGTGGSNSHSHRRTVMDGQNHHLLHVLVSAEEERNPALVLVDDGLVSVRPFVQQTPDYLQAAKMNCPSPPLPHPEDSTPADSIGGPVKPVLPVIRESLSLVSKAAAALADSLPFDSPNHSPFQHSVVESVVESMQQSVPESVQQSLALEGVTVHPPSPSRKNNTGSNSSKLTMAMPDNRTASAVSGLINQSVVKQFSLSSNSKTRLDTLAEGSTGVGAGFGIERTSSIIMREVTMATATPPMLASPSPAISRAPSASRRGTRQVTPLGPVPIYYPESGSSPIFIYYPESDGSPSSFSDISIL